MNSFETFLTKHQHRIVGLDILRSLAILIVVYEHGKFMIPEKYYAAYDSIHFLKIDGVAIFFVLSGFLIGGILLKIISETNFTNKDLLHFWIRRWFRTIPNYLLVLLFLVAYRLFYAIPLSEFNVSYFFFSQNLFSPHPHFFPEAWSLCIEEWFYLLFPLSCFALHKVMNDKTKSLLLSALFFLLFPLLLRIIKYESGIGIEDIDLNFRKIVILRLDSLMYGVIAAYVFFKEPLSWVKYKNYFLISGIVLLVLLYANPWDWKNVYPPLYFNIESITTCCFLPFLSSYKTTKLKRLDAFFIFISLISYSMYLLNLSPVQWSIMPVVNGLLGREILPFEETYVLNTVMYWFFTVFGAYVLYRFYEDPMTRLRDKLTV